MVSLNAQTISGNGALVSRNPSAATINGTAWNIKVGPQEDDYDLKLSLDSSWGFKQNIESTITIFLEGYTPPPLQDPPDADLLLVFAVNDLQYFSFFLHLDIRNVKSRIYGSFDTLPTKEPVSTWLASDTIHERYLRIADGADANWILVHDWNKQIVWPITFMITSNPTERYTLFELFHTNLVTKATQWTFFDTFEPNANIDFYIMGDSTDERYHVRGIHADLSHQTTTAPPTSTTTNPTATPSTNPSKSPSNVPTISPSNNPSTQPTLSPTKNPSQNPTNTPSNHPTSTPSLTPTANPSEMPSLNPTKIPSTNPTNSPSVYPSSNPSNAPSMEPSVNPSATPSTHPTLATDTNAPTVTGSPSVHPTEFNFVLPTTTPTSAPTKKPTIVIETSTNSPTTMTPTAEMSITSTRLSFNSTNETTMIIDTNTLNPANKQIIDYAVVITITFQYRFTLIGKQKIKQILDQIATSLNENRKCKDFKLYSPFFKEKNNITTVNATILVCDEEQQTEILIAVYDPQLKTEIVNMINAGLNDTNSTQMDTNNNDQILTNKTSIFVTDIIIYNTLSPIPPNNGNNDTNIISDLLSPSGERDALFWITIFISAQIASCFLLIGCIVFIKMRTKSIKQKKRARRSTDDGHVSNTRKRKRSIPHRIRNRLSIGYNGHESDHEPGSMFRVESLSHNNDLEENDHIKVFEPQRPSLQRASSSIPNIPPPQLPNAAISYLDVDSNMQKDISLSPDPPSEFRSRSYKVRHYANPQPPHQFHLEHRRSNHGLPPPPRKQRSILTKQLPPKRPSNRDVNSNIFIHESNNSSIASSNIPIPNAMIRKSSGSGDNEISFCIFESTSKYEIAAFGNCGGGIFGIDDDAR